MKLTSSEKRILEEKIQEANAAKTKKMAAIKQTEIDRATMHFLGIRRRIAIQIVIYTPLLIAGSLIIGQLLAPSLHFIFSLLFGLLLVVFLVLEDALARYLRRVLPSVCPKCHMRKTLKKTLRRTGEMRREGDWWGQKIYDEYQCSSCGYIEWKWR
jgi:predicted nucleic-acid-binding Zn-ribbon protein